MTLNERPTFRNPPDLSQCVSVRNPVQETGRRRDRDRPGGYKECAARARVWLKRCAKPREPKTEISERNRL
jgi:hypothetical protein